jgi:2-octaprenylphenol hydroxylase
MRLAVRTGQAGAALDLDPSDSFRFLAIPQELSGGQGRNRTTDTRIFNPLLYQLSYLAMLSPTAARLSPGEGAQYSPIARTGPGAALSDDGWAWAGPGRHPAVRRFLAVSGPYNRPVEPRTASFDVVVVGRGAVGAAAALGIAQTGLRTAWVGPAAPDSTPDVGWDVRVFALSPGTRDLLRALRVWDEMPRSRIAPVYDMRVYGGPGMDAPELHLDAYTGRVDALAWIVENRSLVGALGQALRFAGVTVFEDIVAAMQVSDTPGQGMAVLELGGGRTVSARLVVGADGADSTMRELAGIDVGVRSYGQRGVVANFEATRPHGDTAYQWFGPELGVLALLPLPPETPDRGRASMVWSASDALADRLMALSPEALAEQVGQASQGVLGRLALITAPRDFPLRRILVPTWVAPRLVLVGDAAHAMHPLAGQGMNAGFSDVAELLSVLRGREPFRDLGDRLLWRRYERARRESVALMQGATDGLQRAFGPLPAPIAGLRDLGWRAVAASGWLRRQLIAQAVR